MRHRMQIESTAETQLRNNMKGEKKQKRCPDDVLDRLKKDETGNRKMKKSTKEK